MSQPSSDYGAAVSGVTFMALRIEVCRRLDQVGVRVAGLVLRQPGRCQHALCASEVGAALIAQAHRQQRIGRRSAGVGAGSPAST